MNQNNNKQLQLLHTILSDNKQITKELKDQILIIETLQTTNTTLESKVQQLYRESELCIQRDTLQTKRNVILTRENKELKQNVCLLTDQIQILKDELDTKVRMMKDELGTQFDDMNWHNERLELNGIQLQCKLDQMIKENKWLKNGNKRLRKLVNESE